VSTADDKLARPLLLFDGDCGFCRYWVARWRAITRDQVDYAPAQQEAARFRIPKESWSHSVQLLTPAGANYAGAEAVFRTLASSPGHRWALTAYKRLPGLRTLTEWAYRLVADHRPLFGKLNTIAFGRDPTPPAFQLSRWIFLRLLGVIYLIAFLSFRVQVLGLLGARGILPAGIFLQLVKTNFGSASHRLFPTLAWISSSDASLKLLCSGGALLAVLVILGLATGPALALCWVFYLSLVTIGQDFLAFQWDILLLETGFLAIFLAPWRIPEAPWRASESRASSTTLWLLRWLLFRLMFLSGVVKLASGDPSWCNFTALEYHYWTQPIPTPVAWYAAQLPAWSQRMSVGGVFVLELALPFLVLAPRRLRRTGALLTILFQLSIAITGNYAYFNLLAIVLSLLLLDDSIWSRLLPGWVVRRITAERPRGRLAPAGRKLRVALAAFLLLVSGTEVLSALSLGEVAPGFLHTLVEKQSPFYLANSYGLFAVMTTSRLEIVVEGSDDGVTWRPYEFKYKPGDLARRPPWVAPYQPRLDWQMWFAALGSAQQNRWIVNLLIRLLEGSPDVLALLQGNPFPETPPHYVRAVGYDYHFTDFAQWRATGDWWRREPKGFYFPAASLRGK
jgi:predicted DCC family thiol-disulfide oxidoreductase YuxK